MCSIAGIISLESNVGRKRLESSLEQMKTSLRHRGPDDNGVTIGSFGEGLVGLANTRLAIIDLSFAGHQPMHDQEAALTITYNGEVYNFDELRRELGVESGSWRSRTDTEVVLRTYRRWGVEGFSRLRGMFALAIWDERKDELVLARDPLGIKPLYYATIPDFQMCNSDVNSTSRISQSEVSGVIFASEVRALLASGLVSKKLDWKGVASYLNFGSVQAPLTIIEGVRSIMPGHYLSVRMHNGALQINEQSYLAAKRPRSQDEAPPRSREDALVALREKLSESVRAHLVSDVPLGVFLSGGMDSSALVALMSQVSPERPKTFSVVFDEQKFSEAPYARRVAETFKTDHHDVHLTENRLLSLLPDAVAALDQPTIDGINSFVVSKAVKDEGISVALSGLGGDELFAGYPSFRRALRMQSVSAFSKRLLKSAAVLGQSGLAGSVQRRKFWELAGSDGSPEAVYAVTRQLFSSEEAERIANPRTTDDRDTVIQRSPRLEIHESSFETAFDTVNEISLLELQGYMANTLLRDTDAMSMAHSLEVRVPFVDVEVVRYVLSLPGGWKLNGGRPKPLLADALSDLLPTEFFQRPKMGFTLPFEKWMQSTLREELQDVLKDENRLEAVGLVAEEVELIWQRFLRTPKAVGWSRPWALYVLAKWCEINEVESTDYADCADLRIRLGKEKR